MMKKIYQNDIILDKISDNKELDKKIIKKESKLK